MPYLGLTSVFPVPQDECAPYPGLPVRHGPVKVCGILRLTCAPCPGFCILGFYRRIFPASHDGGVQSCPFNSLYFRRYC